MSSPTQVNDLIKDLKVETVISFTSKSYLSFDELLGINEFYGFVESDGEMDIFISMRVINSVTVYDYRITK